MKTLTPRERLEIYKKMLVRLIEDREYSLNWGTNLGGLCMALFCSASYSLYIQNFPELMAIKPRKTFNELYWWSTNPKSTTRIDKLSEIIERMEKEFNQN